MYYSALFELSMLRPPLINGSPPWRSCNVLDQVHCNTTEPPPYFQLLLPIFQRCQSLRSLDRYGQAADCLDGFCASQRDDWA